MQKNIEVAKLFNVIASLISSSIFIFVVNIFIHLTNIFMLKSSNKFQLIRQIYLYLVAIITIVIFLISSIGLISLGLKHLLKVENYEQIASRDPYECMYQVDGKPIDPVFGNIEEVELSKEEIEERKNECVVRYKERADLNYINGVKRDIVNYLSMLIVAVPIYLFHWAIIRKESKK